MLFRISPTRGTTVYKECVCFRMSGGYWLLPSALLLDLLLGDPRRLPHPVRWIGRLILLSEKIFYPAKRNATRERVGGCVTTAFVTTVCGGSVWVVLAGANAVHPYYTVAVAILIAFYSLAVRSLVNEAANVRALLIKGDLPGARRALSMIVGRDTAHLSREEVVRAAVEAVAESITDGIVSPLWYLALGGPVAVTVFKAISTMDSMIGHRDDRYTHFGSCAARLDDVLNFIPARLTGLLLIPVASLLLHMPWRTSVKIVWRDRLKHDSPNSAHSEAAVAGALGVQLGGGATYEGEYIARPFLGDSGREVTSDMISSANKLAITSAVLMTVLATCVMVLLA